MCDKTYKVRQQSEGLADIVLDLPDAFRVRSLGTDPVEVAEITIKVNAPLADNFQEAVFCEGTKIGDPVTGAGRNYGGGQSFEGKFPGALELRGWGGSGAGAANLPDGWNIVNGQLQVDLPAGKCCARLMSRAVYGQGRGHRPGRRHR